MPFRRFRSHAVRVLPERVRREVWMRDEGCCTVCGAREQLQFAQVVRLERLVGRLASSVAAYLELRCAFCSVVGGRGGRRAQTRQALLGLR